MTNHRRQKYILNSLIFVLETYVVLNLLTIILFPGGLYRIESYTGLYYNPAYILGHRNNAIEYFMPLCGLVVAKDRLEDKKQAGILHLF